MRFFLPLRLLIVIILALCINFCDGMFQDPSTDLSLSQPGRKISKGSMYDKFEFIGSSYYEFKPPTLESSASSMRMETSSYNFDKNGKKNGKSRANEDESVKKNEQPSHAYPSDDQSNQYYTKSSTSYGTVPYYGQGYHSMPGLENITYGSVKENKKSKKWFGKGKGPGKE